MLLGNKELVYHSYVLTSRLANVMTASFRQLNEQRMMQESFTLLKSLHFLDSLVSRQPNQEALDKLISSTQLFDVDILFEKLTSEKFKVVAFVSS